ncbi:DUF551 domain-containing protein [Pantoea sp. CTOTU49201]|uniref:DUF551 domain-containing protein n=1 Tax=Pantoea sp. CTOTU49201 TaxID=2953855 RepID=UPI00289C200B|nr:DUF551 domain-containing protein [Pantoea sp. CTOTU49201]
MNNHQEMSAKKKDELLHCARILASVSTNEEIVEVAKISIALLITKENGWISCMDRMPPDGKGVLTWDGVFEKILHTMYGHWQCWQPGKITHWQFLPAPPQPTTDTYQQIQNDERGG